MIQNPEQLLEPIDTIELPFPVTAQTREEGKAEIAKIAHKIKRLARGIAPLREEVLRVYREIASLNAERHAIETHLTVGIKKIPRGKVGVSIPKVENEEEYFKYLQSLSSEQLNHLLES